MIYLCEHMISSMEDFFPLDICIYKYIQFQSDPKGILIFVSFNSKNVFGGTNELLLCSLFLGML